MIHRCFVLCLLVVPPVACFVVQLTRPHNHNKALQAANASPKDPAKKIPSKNAGGGGKKKTASQPKDAVKTKSPQKSAITANKSPANRAVSKNVNNGDGKSGVVGGFSVRFVFSAYDLDDDPDTDLYEDDILKFKNDATIKDILKALRDNFGLDRAEMENLEYLSDGEWKPLNDPSALKGKQAVPIRNATTFDSSYDDWVVDGNENFGYGYDDSSGPSLTMQIRDIVTELGNKEYTYSTTTMQLVAKSGEVISTKDYVLNKALNDKALQEALLSKIGCLDHIVQAIHFPFLWKEESDSKDTGERD